MRKVKLRMNEDRKYTVIKELVDHNGNKKRAALKLKCTTRTINRLIVTYKTKGKEGFIHGNRGRLPVTAVPVEVKTRIMNLYLEKYADCNLTHYAEIIKEDMDIDISATALNYWLRELFVLSPKARSKTKRHLKQLLKVKADAVKSQKLKNQYIEAISTIDSKDAHPRRPRCKYFGEMIQMDASSYFWINGALWHLHLAIDDATNTVVGAYFDTQETLNGYYHVFYQILTNYGIPAMFYVDKRTVFEYKRKNNAFDDEDTFTQFAYACHQLGVEIKTTSVPEAKGRIERLNQTFQSRLPVDLRRAAIASLEDANEFLASYLKKFNKQFALHLNTTKSVFETQPSAKLINQTLSVISQRKVCAGHTIKFLNKHYLPISADNSPVYLKEGSSCLVIQAFDKKLYGNILDHIYLLDEVPLHELVSKNFDIPVAGPKKERKRYIPPLSHPWRQYSFLSFAAKQKHRIDSANV